MCPAWNSKCSSINDAIKKSLPENLPLPAGIKGHDIQKETLSEETPAEEVSVEEMSEEKENKKSDSGDKDES